MSVSTARQKRVGARTKNGHFKNPGSDERKLAAEVARAFKVWKAKPKNRQAARAQSWYTRRRRPLEQEGGS